MLDFGPEESATAHGGQLHRSETAEGAVMTMLTKARTYSLRAILAVGLVALAAVTLSARAADRPDLQTAIHSGSELESDTRWKEAVDHYKDSLKIWPDDETLKLGLRRSQFQFSITRRYDDDTFVTSLKPMSRDAAMALYDDVLTHIQMSFVDPINTTSVVAHGTESLWLALGNPEFLEKNLVAASSTQLNSLRRELFEKFWNKSVAHQFAAREVINDVCTLCQSRVGLDSSAVIMEYVFGACNCLDDYSNVLTPGKRQDLYGNIRGEFVGVGIVMESETDHGMKLIQVLPESPAREAGLKRGEFIVGIDGQNARPMSTDQAANLLAGKSGSRVLLEVERYDGSTYEVTCTRREVHVKSVATAKIIDPTNGVGYIQMTGFQQGTVAEMDAALTELKKQGMRSLIWDLRDNPGGLLTAAIELLDRFIDDGVIVSTRGRAPDQSMTYTAHRPGTWDLPVVLVINENSASASEIVAGAIRDHQRGTIVGRTSFGKWSVQSIFDLRYGTAIRMTTAKFYSPRGNTWGKIGLQPDVVVDAGPESPPLGEVDLNNDADLREALRQLRGQEFTKR
ncbi:MAG: S41 family peptidase [Planctomycetaceae bacterium]|nr:S41 family peptidase [Planctomycetaceae bacterium]